MIHLFVVAPSSSERDERTSLSGQQGLPIGAKHNNVPTLVNEQAAFDTYLAAALATPNQTTTIFDETVSTRIGLSQQYALLNIRPESVGWLPGSAVGKFPCKR